jgi:hypothetical protein
MSACILDGTVGQLLVYTQTLPLLIGAGFTAMTTITGSLYFAFLGGYLFVAQYFMWPIQAYINQQRSPYLCPMGSAVYQFPSVEAFYVFAIGTMVIMYIILYKGNHGVVTWGTLAFWFLIPAGVLVFFQMNTWQEVLFSAGLAVGLTAIFMVHMFMFIDPCLPFLEVRSKKSGCAREVSPPPLRGGGASKLHKITFSKRFCRHSRHFPTRTTTGGVGVESGTRIIICIDAAYTRYVASIISVICSYPKRRNNNKNLYAKIFSKSL